jgi:hypothetical protein
MGGLIITGSWTGATHIHPPSIEMLTVCYASRIVMHYEQRQKDTMTEETELIGGGKKVCRNFKM